MLKSAEWWQRRHRWFIRGAVSALLLTATACGGLPNGNESGNESGNGNGNRGGGEASAVKDDVPDKPELSTFTVPERDAEKMAKARKESLRMQRGSGKGLVSIDALTKYVNDVMERVKRASPVPDIETRVFVAESDVMNAYARADGNIFVTRPFLENLEYEGELAALLAHELAHVAYRHGDSDGWIEAQKQLISLQALVADAWDGAQESEESGGPGQESSEERQELRKIQLMTRASHFLSETVIAPVYTRDQEDQADFFAVDVLEKTQYDSGNMEQVVSILSKQQSRNAKRKTEMQKRLADNLGRFGANEILDGEGGVFKEKLAGGIKSASGWAVETWRDLFGDDHRKPDVRQTLIHSYRGTHYGDGQSELIVTRLPWEGGAPEGADVKQLRTVFANYGHTEDARDALADEDFQKAVARARKAVSGPTKYAPHPRHTFYRIRDEQGRNRKAWANLEIALEAEDSSVFFYRQAIERAAMEDRDYGRALEIAERAKKEVGDPPRL